MIGPRFIFSRTRSSGITQTCFLKEDVDGNRSINDPNIENGQGSELAGLDNTPSSTH